MVTNWTNDPLSKDVHCLAQHINELRAAIEAVPNVTVIPWGRLNRVDTETHIQAQHLLDLRGAIGPGSAAGTVWQVRGISAGPMLWTQTVPGGGGLGGYLRATHVDDRAVGSTPPSWPPASTTSPTSAHSCSGLIRRGRSGKQARSTRMTR